MTNKNLDEVRQIIPALGRFPHGVRQPRLFLLEGGEYEKKAR